MLSNARSKSETVRWIEGDVGALPFGNSSFEGVLCSLAIHHFQSLENAFAEVRRVLANGRFVLFTSTTEQMNGYWLKEYFPVALGRSSEQMPCFNDIEEALESAGLRIVKVENYAVLGDLSDFFLYSGKHRPEMYLDEKVRRGISTFSSLADESEIVEGCKRLESDLETGKINEVIASYANDLGDYCFVVSE